MAAAGRSDAVRVYRAVAAGESAEEVRRAIEADGEAAEARQLAVNKPFHETPLQAAHRLRRVDLVALLLEQGADSRDLFEGGVRLTPLALAVTYGLAGTVRALLAAGHDPNEEIAYAPGCSLDLPPPYAVGCTVLFAPGRRAPRPVVVHLDPRTAAAPASRMPPRPPAGRRG
jgi:hypothetical protein